MKVKNENDETVKAGCIIVNDTTRQVLLVTDAQNKVWAFPKGHAEAGETLEQVALREVKEETGYEVETIKRLSDVTYTHGQTGEPIRVAMFQARPLKVAGPGEDVIHSHWFSIDEAREMLYHNLVILLDELNWDDR